MLSTRQRKRIRRGILTSVTIAFIAGAAWLIFQWASDRKIKFTRYPEFGISIPENYSVHGIDVSKYQDRIAWEEVQVMKVRNVQVGFAFIKATEGIANIDPQFRRNWRKSKEAGVCHGAYHFFIGSKDGRMQAENYINKVDLEPGDLPPVLDVEQVNGSSPEQFKAEVRKWLDIVETYYHVKPIIYTNVDFYTRNLGSDFDSYPLWVAHYYQTDQPKIKRDWIFWQHSEEGRVNGIISPVDFNVFNGDSLEFRLILLR